MYSDGTLTLALSPEGRGDGTLTLTLSPEGRGDGTLGDGMDIICPAPRGNLADIIRQACKE